MRSEGSEQQQQFVHKHVGPFKKKQIEGFVHFAGIQGCPKQVRLCLTIWTVIKTSKYTL